MRDQVIAGRSHQYLLPASLKWHCAHVWDVRTSKFELDTKIGEKLWKERFFAMSFHAPVTRIKNARMPDDVFRCLYCEETSMQVTMCEWGNRRRHEEK